jgi:chromosome partitioning protein
MSTYAIANYKGGVGKTTTAVNLAAALAERGRRVLLVDLDPQGAVANALRLTVPDGAPTIYELLSGAETVLERTILPVASEPGLHVVPATANLSAALAELPGSETPWQWLLADLISRQSLADDVVIDTPPGLGSLPLLALVAADGVVIPTELEDASWLKIYELLRSVALVQTRPASRPMNPGLRVIGVIPTMVDRRSRFALDVLAQLRSELPVPLIEPAIPARVEVKRAAREGLPVTRFAPDGEAAEAYRALAALIVNEGDR